MESNAKYKKTFKSGDIERVSEETIPWYSKRLFKEHKIRYFFVKKFVKNKIVVDVACGNGYGTYLLANSGARFVYGIDNNKKAIELAKKNYQQKNINFILGNAQKISLKSNLADVVVSFETIEHLKYPKKFLKETKRILKPRGILLLSTPNREISYEDNPYHLNEYTFPELNTLLSDFPEKIFFGQRPVYKHVVRLYKNIYKNISSIPTLVPLKFFLRFRPWESQKIAKLKNLSDSGYMYIIAICKNH